MTPCCFVCGKILEQDRIEALEFLGKPKDQWDCIDDSQTKKVKGVYEGEYGTGKLIIAQDVGGEGIDKTIEEARDEE